MLKKMIAIPAGAARPGLPLRYEVKVGDKWILTGGWVQKAVKTGENQITVTVKHWKTGEVFTNVLGADWKIQIHLVALVNQGHTGSLTLWPTYDNVTLMQQRRNTWITEFNAAAVGTEF